MFLKRVRLLSLLKPCRGAGASKGRTSWSSKPEQQDYASFVGLLVHYLHHLDPGTYPPSPNPSSPGPPHHLLSPISSSVPSPSRSGEVSLVVGGYSYGSLIARYLPPLEFVLARFVRPTRGTAEAEIRLRAEHLAGAWNEEHRVRRQARAGAVHGGEEGKPGARRSREASRRSVEFIRRSVDRSREKLGLTARREPAEPQGETEELVTVEVPAPQTSFLLVSPLLGPVSMLLTLFAKHGQSHGKEKGDHGWESNGVGEDDKLSTHPTLAIYGNDDFFTSSKKLQRWAVHLAAQPGSLFKSVEVPEAGHFWQDPGAQRLLVDAVKKWLQELPP